MNRLKKRIPVFLCVLCVLCGESQLRAQKHLVLDLNRTISLANDSSLESFRTQNMYLSGYWEYRTFRANRLPSLTLDVTPAQYNRDITKRYDSGQDLDVYRTQQSYYAYGGLSVKQNFDLTGGTFYLESNLAYMRNFGSNSATQLTSVPIRIGYSQSLVGYNSFKWERRIEPLKYERVKKEFLYNVEKVSETATNYFFSLAMAQAEYNLAKENLASTDTLYRIGQQRHRIAAISQADLLTLKLDRVNAQNTLQNKASDLKRAMFSLASFLNLDKNTQIKLELPYRILRLCGGDMGFTSSICYDFEVYSEAQKRWLEVSSVSNFDTYQANRLKCRYRRTEDKKTELCHTLNGSALALPRIVAAIMENNQTPEGIRMPKCLVPYCGFEMLDDQPC